VPAPTTRQAEVLGLLAEGRIRFENRTLPENLKVQTNEAETARRRAEQASLAKSQFLAAASRPSAP
jgi:hypothetical protein